MPPAATALSRWFLAARTLESPGENGRRLLAWVLSAGEMMAQVLIRQLDDHVVAALRARAQAQGVSLEQSLRDLLTATARQGHALRDELAQLRATTPSSGRQLNVAALIRDDRDGR